MSPDNILFGLAGFFGGMAFLMVVQAVADWRQCRANERHAAWIMRRDALHQHQQMAKTLKRL